MKFLDSPPSCYDRPLSKFGYTFQVENRPFCTSIFLSEKVKMALSLELSGILWWNFAYTLILTRSIPRHCEMTIIIGPGFAELRILKKSENGPISWLSGILWWNSAYTSILTSSSPRDYKMTFIIGWGFAELQTLTVGEKLVNHLEYFDKHLHTHWYWRKLAQEIAKWHLLIGRGFAKLQILKKWKWPYLLNWADFACILILISSSTRGCEMIFIIGRGFAALRILKKKWKYPSLLNWVEYCDEILHTHWYWQDLAQEIAKWHKFYHRSMLCRVPNSEKVKWPYLLNWMEKGLPVGLRCYNIRGLIQVKIRL